jgi:hypothetical protein
MTNANKTVGLAISGSEVTAIIDAGKLLSVMDYSEDLSYTRPYLQDLGYCSFGWSTGEANLIINYMVDKGIFNLI